MQIIKTIKMHLVTNFNKMIDRAITRTMDRLNDRIILNTTEALIGMQLPAAPIPLLCAEEIDFLSINEWIKDQDDRSKIKAL